MSVDETDDVSQLVVVSDLLNSPTEQMTFFADTTSCDITVDDAAMTVPSIVVQTCSPEECPLKADVQHLLCASAMRTPLQFSPFSSTQSGLMPACRICQCFGSSPDSLGIAAGGAGAASRLISPCRCTGTLQFVHPHCLRRWLEVRGKTKWVENGTNLPPSCELCGYTYRMHKRLRIRGWQCPSVTTNDKVLHTVFFICILLMGICGAAAILCFVTNGVGLGLIASPDKVDLSREEIVSLSCGIGCFVSFFVAMAVEIKAKQTIFRVCSTCIHMNTVWFFENHAADSCETRGRRAAEAETV